MSDIPTAESIDGSRPVPRPNWLRQNIEYSPSVAAGLVAAGDFVAILLTSLFAISRTGLDALASGGYAVMSVSAAVVIQSACAYFDLYNFDDLIHPIDRLRWLAASCCSAVPLLYLGAYSYALPDPLLWCLVSGVMIGVVLFGERWAAYKTIYLLSRCGLATRNVVISGCDTQRERLLQVLGGARRPWNRILGIFDDSGNSAENFDRHLKIDSAEGLIDLSRHTRIDDVFLAPGTGETATAKSPLDALRVLPANIYTSTDRTYTTGKLVSVLTATRLSAKPLTGWVAVVKATEDMIIATCGLLLLAPLMVSVAFAIKLESEGPVLFRQRRFGFNNQIIEIYKFRTMFNEQRDDDAEQLTRKGDSRITPLGRLLRRTGIDELPQLFNVLRRDMSIIGPRPHAMKARSGGKPYDEVAFRYAERHKIKPGITGWAQVNGWRGDADGEEGLRRRVECDIYYMEHWSIAFDILIMIRTLVVLVSGRGAC